MTIRELTHVCDYLDKIREDLIAVEHRLDSLIENNMYESYEYNEGLKEYHNLFQMKKTICALMKHIGYTVGLNENYKHTIFERED